MSDIITTARVAKSEETIRAANDQFGQHFSEWALVVGSELQAAQEELAEHKAGFGKWCKDKFGWSTSRTHEILNAAETIRLTSAIAEVAPTNEAQCRELAKVPEEHVAEVWRQVVMASEKTEKPITASRIKKHIEKQAKEAGPAEGGGGDEEKPKKPAKTVKPDKPADDEIADEPDTDDTDETETSDLPAFTASIVLDALAQPIPPEYRNAHQLSITLMSVGRELDKYRKQAKELKEQPGGEWLQIQLIDEGVRMLKAYFQGARYHALCPSCDGKGGEECKKCHGSGFLPEYLKETI
ncbi:MAG: hypothetical protein GY903_01195 [Fuerstiella sp.]|nr:hypothetical protein [Fuerstiella sp.]MCP4853094.1 hypothetical protein [Fuerstiella sp.]